ncbi:MAG: oligosaccharide flippase family protein [Lachnospiraceae bacterium]|nr:oligosaccharide flippase family protein [Lachnospiraceae bacterium]
MQNNSDKAVRSGLWYVVSNVMIRAVGIITAPIYTRLLTTSESGFANNFNNYVSLFTVVTCLCLIYSVGRAKIDFPDDFDGYMSSIQALSSIFGLFVLIMVMVLSPPSGLLGYDKLIIFIMFFYLVIFPSIDYRQYKYRFEYKYRENIAISVIITVTTVALSIGLIYLMPYDKGFAKILGTVIPSGLVAIWCYVSLVKEGKKFINRKYWAYALRIGLPMIPHGLAMIMLARIDTSMISAMCTYAEVGLYTWGYTIGTLLMFVSNAIGQAWLPWFNERLADGDYALIKEKNRLLMAAGCFLSLIFIGLSPEAVKILMAKPYHECMWVVPPVALGTLCQYFYTNYVNQELFHKKTVMIAVNSIIAALINTGLNYVFIQRYGYIAAAYTTLAGYFILMVLHYISTRLVLKEDLYHNGQYFAMLIVTASFGLSMMYVYEKPVLRYIIVAALTAVFAFIYRYDIIRLYKQFTKNKRTRGETRGS